MAANEIPISPTGSPRNVAGKVRPFDDVELDYFVIEGEEPGRSLLITAGVHGSEVCAIETARRLKNLPPKHLKGTLVVIPVLNVEGFKQHSIFVMPEDGKNLNRVFPGKPDGSKSERIAHWLVEEIYPQFDAYIDLHSADATEKLTTFTAFIEGDRRAKLMATCFGIDVAAQVGRTGDLTLHGAAKAGIPGIIMERGGQGFYTEDDIIGMTADIAVIADELEILVAPASDGSMTRDNARDFNQHGKLVLPVGEPLRGKTRIVKPTSIEAPCDGCWIPFTSPRRPIHQGDVIGQIETIGGDVLQTIKSDIDGMHLYGSTALWVGKGDLLCSVASGVI